MLRRVSPKRIWVLATYMCIFITCKSVPANGKAIDIDWKKEISSMQRLIRQDYTKFTRDFFTPDFLRISPNSLIQADFEELTEHLSGRQHTGGYILGAINVVSTCGNTALVWQHLTFTDGDRLRRDGTHHFHAIAFWMFVLTRLSSGQIEEKRWVEEIKIRHQQFYQEYEANDMTKAAKDAFAEEFVRISPHSIIRGDFKELAKHFARHAKVGHYEIGHSNFVSVCSNTAVVWNSILFTGDNNLTNPWMYHLHGIAFWMCALTLHSSGQTEEIKWAEEIDRIRQLFYKEFDEDEMAKAVKDTFTEGFVRISPNSIIRGDFKELASHFLTRHKTGHYQMGHPKIVSACSNTAVVWNTILFTDDKNLTKQWLETLFYEYVDGNAKIKLLQVTV